MTDTLAGFWVNQLEWPEAATLDDIQGAVPDYTPEEMAEIVRLVHPLRIERDGRWVMIPTDLASLRQYRAEYLSHVRTQQMADFKSSAGYRRALLAAERERQDEREDRALQQQREAANGKERRYQELLAAGVNPLEAAQIAEQKTAA